MFCRGDEILAETLPSFRAHRDTPSGQQNADSNGLILPSGLLDLPYRDAKQQALETFEAAYFDAVLRRTGGNISEAARQAGLDRSNFRRAAKRVGVAGGVEPD